MQIDQATNSLIRKKVAGVGKLIGPAVRIDMTPMVDLGFLLITFFIFTTTLSSPTRMNLVMPKDGDSTAVKSSGAMTILIGKDRLYYYFNELEPGGSNIQFTDFASLRSVILNKKAAVINNHMHDAICESIIRRDGANSCQDKDLVIIIKPGVDASYRNIIAVLDEMAINVIKRYALIDMDVRERYAIEEMKDEGGSSI